MTDHGEVTLLVSNSSAKRYFYLHFTIIILTSLKTTKLYQHHVHQRY